jgi:hypothetical protein
MNLHPIQRIMRHGYAEDDVVLRHEEAVDPGPLSPKDSKNVGFSGGGINPKNAIHGVFPEV